MVRLGKLTDYGMLLMSCFARGPVGMLRSARDLAAEAKLPLPTVSKLLKELLRSGLLVSHRGIQGGYCLAKDATEISLAEIVAALEGPIGLTECSTHVNSCEIESCCSIKKNQQVISRAVVSVLEKLTLADLNQPLQLTAMKDANGNPLPMGLVSGRTQ